VGGWLAGWGWGGVGAASLLPQAKTGVDIELHTSRTHHKRANTHTATSQTQTRDRERTRPHRPAACHWRAGCPPTPSGSSSSCRRAQRGARWTGGGTMRSQSACGLGCGRGWCGLRRVVRAQSRIAAALWHPRGPTPLLTVPWHTPCNHKLFNQPPQPPPVNPGTSQTTGWCKRCCSACASRTQCRHKGRRTCSCLQTGRSGSGAGISSRSC